MIYIYDNGVYEVECRLALSWICNADIIAEIMDYYKYDFYNNNLSIIDANLR